MKDSEWYASTFFLFACMLVLLFGMFSIMPAKADIYSEQNLLNPFEAAELYGMAHSLSRIPLPAQHPTINSVPKAKLQALMCPPTHKDCSVSAGYLRGVVYIDDALPVADPHTRLILLHELAHYLQAMKAARTYRLAKTTLSEDESWGEAKTCQERFDRELQAYAVQKYAADKIGVSFMMPVLPTCPA